MFCWCCVPFSSSSASFAVPCHCRRRRCRRFWHPPRARGEREVFRSFQLNFIRLKDSSRAASPPAGHSSAAAEAANLICRMSVTPQHEEKRQKNGTRGGGGRALRHAKKISFCGEFVEINFIF
ncbi:hypothetical protein niasHT_025458 [Heterodera trifolii]|uniref:Secreted protein n=1 Tax=Heterodera trifolii TaxID=157864 RepID=A0ABD2JWZ4_9BILA